MDKKTALNQFRKDGMLYPYVTSTHKDSEVAKYGLGKNWEDWKANERNVLWKQYFPNEAAPKVWKDPWNKRLLNAMLTSALGVGIDLSLNHFEVLRAKLAAVENGGRDLILGIDNCNLYDGDYHLGYQQLSYINFYVLSKYLNVVLFPGQTDGYIENYIADVREALEKDIEIAKQNAIQKGKNPKFPSNFDSTHFPIIFDETAQDLYLALFILDRLRIRRLETLEEFVVNNPRGRWRATWSLKQLNGPIYRSPNSITYFDYLAYSDSTITGQSTLGEIFKTPTSSSKLLDDAVSWLKLKWDSASPDSVIKNIFEQKPWIDKVFDIAYMNGVDKDGNPRIYEYKKWRKEAKQSLVIDDKPSLATAIRTYTKEKAAEPDFDLLKDDPRLYRLGEDADTTGHMYIGDILFSIPPVAMRFGTTNQAMSIPTIRTKGDPVLTTNNEMARVDITLYFSGEIAINEQLRPLVAMYQTMPFTTVQNTTIFDSWIGRKNSFHTISEYDLTDAEALKRRFNPIPIYLENISLSTIPGFPNSIQAHISLIKMNRFPYGVQAKMWKTWDIAREVSIEKALRYSLDNTILGSTHDPNDNERNAKSTIEILDSVGKKHIIEIGNHSGSTYRPDDPDHTTLYPQESEPFQIQYKNVLRDFPTHIGAKLRKSNKNDEPDIEKYWPPYLPEHNDRLYLTYNTPRGFRTVQTAFKERMYALSKVYTLMNTAIRQLEVMDTAELKELYKPIGSRPSISDLIDNFLKSISFVKEARQLGEAVNEGLRLYITDLVKNDIFVPYVSSNALAQGTLIVSDLGKCTGGGSTGAEENQTECEGVGGSWTDIIQAFEINLESTMYVDENLEIQSVTKNLLDWVDTLIQKEIENSDEVIRVGDNDEPVTNAFEHIIKPLYEKMASDPLAFFGIQEIESLLNYDKVHVELSWQNNPVAPLTPDEKAAEILKATTVEQKRALEALGEAVAIDTLVQQGEHYEKDPAYPYRYRFQSVLQSITYNYANNVIPLYLSSSSTPTFQHMGIPNPTVTLSLRTRDERLHKILTDMKEAVQEVGSMIMSGHTSLLGRDKLTLSGNNTGLNTGVFSGHLLNSLGFTQCVIQNVSSRSLEGFPGWWEISVDLIGDTQNLRLLEQLKPLDLPELSDLPYIMQHFFPTPLINVNIEPTMLFPSAILEMQQLMSKIEKKELYMETPEFKKKASSYGYVSNYGQGRSEYDIEFQRLRSLKARLKKLVDEANQTRFKNINAITIYLELDETKNTYTCHINYGKSEAEDAETRNVIDMVNHVINADGQNNVVSIIIEHLNKLTQWEAFKRASGPEGFDRDYPKKYSISRTLALHYQDYLKSIIDIIHSLVQRDPEAFYTRGGATRGIAYPMVDIPIDLSKNPMHLEFMILSNRIKTTFFHLLRRQDFREFLDSYIADTQIFTHDLLKLFLQNLERMIQNLETKIGTNTTMVVEQAFLDALLAQQIEYQGHQEVLNENAQQRGEGPNRAINITEAYKDLIRKINESVTETYPDLRLPNDVDPRTGHRYSSPGFPFVDQDPDLEIIEMNKAAEQMKAMVFAQFASISSGKFLESYKGLKSLFVGADGSEDAAKKMNVQKAMYHTLEKAGIGDVFPVSQDASDSASFVDVTKMLDDLRGVGDVFARISEEERDDSTLEPGIYVWRDNRGEVHTKKRNASGAWEDYPAGTRTPDVPATVKVLTISQYETAMRTGGPAFSEAEIVITKKELMKLMSRSALLDYLITMIYAASFNEKLSGTLSVKLEDLQDVAQDTYKILHSFDVDIDTHAETLASAIAVGAPGTNHTTDSGFQVTDAGNEIGLQLAAALLQKRTLAVNMAKMADEDNPDAFLHYFGIGSIDNPELKTEMLNKFSRYLQTKRKGTMDRAFPTFKIFFIEEDNYVWKAFDDFYSYDAASEISIVENKHAASKTAVIRLSNVTNILTNDIYEGILNESLNPVPGHALSLKVGTQLMILIGYGSDYRQLRMKFKGAVTEINPGSILEVTAQSWGAGLLNNVGALGGVKYSATSGATTLGAAVIDILAQTPGLRQLGRWQMRDAALNDPSHVSETSLKNVYWARVLVGLTGPLHDFNPIQTNFASVIDSLPHTGEMLRSEYRKNNVIVKSFGNSLYDNIIINDTRAHGYGFTNWFYRVWDSATKSLSLNPKTAGFNWYVVRQTAWDALHEIALFLGDYIVTTLPFNEGKDIFLEPPRETLYFGPREGQYQASQFLPRLDVEARLKNILSKVERPVSASTVKSEKQKDDRKTILHLGKRALGETLNDMWDIALPGSAKFGFHTSDTARNIWGNDERLLPLFVRTLESEGWNRVANLIKKSVGNPTSYPHTRAITDSPADSPALNVMLHKDENIPAHTLHQILLADLRGKYLPTDRLKSQQYTYSNEDYIIFKALIDGDIDYITGTKGGTADGESSKKGDPDFQKFIYYYPTAGSNRGYSAVVKKRPTGYYNRLYDPGGGTASPFESIHKEQPKSVFYYMFFYEWGGLYRGPRQRIFKMYPHYLSNIDDAIILDAYDMMANFVQRQKAGLGAQATGVRIDLESAMNAIGGSYQLFQYKPTIGTHVVNSYEDIIDNSIIATADQMYNHVEILYDDEPDPSKDDGSKGAKYRAQAWISYDQDPDYLRSYQTYMKNLDPNLFYNTFEANAYIDAANTETQSANMLTQHAIAQQVLMNVMRPMYQGTLTMLGNPHIKPWDQVFIHDDSIAMYGPIEVEQVVNTISATGGYTTTVVPNLCVTYKSASKQIDDLILSLHSTIQTAGLIGTLLKHAATIGAIWFAMKPKIFHPFQGNIGGKLGKYLKAGVVDVKESSAILEKAKKVKKLETFKKMTKKNMTNSDYKLAVETHELYTKEGTKRNMITKQFANDILADLPGSGETGGVKGGKSTAAKLNNSAERLTGNPLDRRTQSKYWKATGDAYKKAAKGAAKGTPEWIRYDNWKKANKSGGQQTTLRGPSVSRLRIQSKITRYGNSLKATLQLAAAEGTVTPKALTAAEKTIDDVLKKATRANANGQTLNNQKNRLINLQRKTFARESKGAMNKIIDKSVSNLSIRSSLMGGALRVLNWVGWVWTAYEVGSAIWDSLTVYATGRIFLAGLLAGENQLAWIPLEYQGKEYVAGLEGIMGTPRGIDTILWGEFQGDNNQFNRVMSLLEMTMQGE